MVEVNIHFLDILPMANETDPCFRIYLHSKSCFHASGKYSRLSIKPVLGHMKEHFTHADIY